MSKLENYTAWYNNLLNRQRTKELDSTNDVLEDSLLQISKIDLHVINNGNLHHTHKYELVSMRNTPVFRRSSIFTMTLEMQNRPLNFEEDIVTLVFEFGSYGGNVTRGTKFIQDLDLNKKNLNENKALWDFIVVNTLNTRLTLQVQIGCEAPVGVWILSIQTSTVKGGRKYTQTFYSKTPIYILFNPYSSNDSVFMPSVAKLKEYIQNDVGVIWRGEYNHRDGRHWIFGQFDEMILPSICFIMDTISGLKDFERGNPILVSRAISSIVNSIDDNGILMGRWSNPYDDGTAPWNWSGSIKIIQEYIETNTSVRYGQCWVFSALVVTICRSLGLPCRSVTNYYSAHDGNNSLTIDKFFNLSGELMTSKDHPEVVDETIWNFHVWNDVWMSRSDLKKDYGGWQAIDSTPQERSEGKYQCGPCPIEAVRRGDVGLSYDAAFLFAEVNADICYFLENEESNWGFISTSIKTDAIGKLIITNTGGGNNDRGSYEDITKEYKNKERTAEERESFFKAVRGNRLAMKYYGLYDSTNTYNDVTFEFLELTPILYGNDFIIRINLENKSNEVRSLTSKLSCSSVYYTGARGYLIKKEDSALIIEALQKAQLHLLVTSADYYDKLVDYCNIKIQGLIQVEETNQSWTDEINFKLNKPELKILVLGHLRKDITSKIRISFTNSLSIPLTNCKLTVECSGAFRQVQETVVNVDANDDMTQVVSVLPKKSGKGSVVAIFSSDEMIDVYGTLRTVIYE